MSRIYKALQKAEQEKKIGFSREVQPAAAEEGKKIRLEFPWPAPRSAGEAVDPRLVSFLRPGSLAAEQFRKLRTQLLGLQISPPPRTILVTSSTSEEGKTFVAANLAAGIACDLQAHALLVDCDLRNPTLGSWFGLQNRSGLSDYLVGQGQVPGMIFKTEIDKLSILPRGKVQENPTELIGSKKMRRLVEELKARYSDRYVLLDSTSLLSTSEPELLSHIVDGIVVVVRAGVTPRETIQQALSSLEKGKILGVVLNDLEFRSPALFSRYFGRNDDYALPSANGRRKSKGGRPSRLQRIRRPG